MRALNGNDLLSSLDNFVQQRPGMQFANYGCVSAYRQESAKISRQLRDYRKLSAKVSGLMAAGVLCRHDLLIQSRVSYSGRLSFTQSADGTDVVDYTTGQYFATEYRAAACTILAALIRDLEEERIDYVWERDGVMDLESVRKSIRNQLGRGIQSRWF